MGNKIKKILIASILPILFLAIWEVAASKINSQVILPSPSSVINNFIHAFDNFVGLGSIPKNIFYSLVRVLLGYLFGILIALPLGLLMGYYNFMANLCENFISIFKPIPSIAWQPLVLGWFGIKSIATVMNMSYGATYAVWDNFKLSMIFLIALGSFFPIFGNVLFGVRNVRTTFIESAKVLGASEKDIFFRVLLPGAAPTIINGMRMGLASSWVCLVSAEMLPGSMSGVGYLITHAYELARVDLVITGMVCIGLIGALLDGVFRIIVKKYFSWENKVK
ncbi:MAG: ABC transporter permease [Oscillospiraceae bacterium]